MKSAVSTGINFGLTSGVITTLGLIVGLHSGTHSKLAVIGGIVTIAIADSMSDALGIHIAQESDAATSNRDIWIATAVTLVSKMAMAMTFMIPMLVFELKPAIIISVIWGLLVITLLSYSIAKKQKERPFTAVFEHLVITVGVIIVTHNAGDLVSEYFR